MSLAPPCKAGAKGCNSLPVPLAFISTAALVAVSAVTAEGRAQECFLSRSPVLMPFAPGASEQLECEYDADGNGLDDVVEE